MAGKRFPAFQLRGRSSGGRCRPAIEPVQEGAMRKTLLVTGAAAMSVLLASSVSAATKRDADRERDRDHRGAGRDASNGGPTFTPIGFAPGSPYSAILSINLQWTIVMAN